MPYATAYQIRFKPVDGNPITVNIYDTKTTTTGATTFIDLGYGPEKKYPASVFTDTTIDNANDKFNPIRAKQATISFFSDIYDASFFSTGEDNRFYVEAVVSSTGDIIFRGFLLADDNEQPLLPNPQIVTLKATDNVGTLKEIALVDNTGTNPRKANKIIKYIAWALQQTGLQLNINLADNFYEESFPDLPAFDNVYLDAKTFEKDINVSEDCYTVLSKILGYKLFLSQISGEWWIQNIDEYGLPNSKVFKFDSQGNYLSQSTKTFNQVIGRTHDMVFFRKDQAVHYVRANKFVKLVYNFEYPKEIIDNIDFSRGAVLSPLSPSLYPFVQVYASSSGFPFPGDTANLYQATNTGTFYKWSSGAYVPLDSSEIPQGVGYNIDDWLLVNLSVVNPTPTCSAYTERIFQGGYEKERYAVFSGNISTNAIRSNRVPVVYKDKFTLSVDRRITKDLGGSGSYASAFIIVRLYGDNGTYWLLANGADTGTKWLQSNAQFTQNNTSGFVYGFYDKSEDFTQWKSGAVQAPPVPASGELEIYLLQSHDVSGADTHFQNLQFDYQPYINGSYQKYKGISRQVTQSGAYKANIDDSVYVYDGIRKLFKGAMYKMVSGKLTLTERWYAGAALAAQGIVPPIPTQYLHPLGHLQIYSVWNQYYRDMKIIEGTIKGLRTTVDNGMPDMIHLFGIDLANPATTNKQFVSSKSDRDFHLGEWRATLMEVFDTTIPKDYNSQQTIVYITDLTN